jgi:hypothetical protein
MRCLPALVLLAAACGGSSKPAPEPVIANTATPPPAEEPDAQRDPHLEEAPSRGVLGDQGGLTYGGDFAVLTGTGDISSGFDDTNIYGGLLYGGGTYGSGGGGTGWGTIGTGRYGTIGHSSGTGSGSSTSKVPTVRIGQPEATGDLDKAIIRRYIKRNIQKIQYCYEKFLLGQPTAEGRVDTSFTIEPDGKVTSSTATGIDPLVADCVAAVIGSIEFPKPKGGGVVNVKYPFTFRPTGG